MPLMKRGIFSIFLLASALVAGTAHAQLKIGFVNIERILKESAPAVRAQKKIESEFAKRDQELGKMAEQLKRMQEDLEKNSVTMPESQRRNKERDFGDLNREFQRKQREFREDLNARRNEELAHVIEQVKRVIQQLAVQENYDVILQDVVFAHSRIEITDKVIKALDGSKPPAR